MGGNRAHLKIRAKGLLIGNTGKAVFMLLIPAVASALLKSVGALTAAASSMPALAGLLQADWMQYALPVLLFVLAILSVLALSPMYLGREAWFWERSGREYRSAVYLFHWYKRAGRGIGLYVQRWLLRLGWSVLFLLPGTALGVGTTLWAWRGIEGYVLLALGVGTGCLLACGVFFNALFLQRYFLAPYLIAEHPELHAHTALKESGRIMDRCAQRGKVAKMKLSFLPWVLSCVFLFPVFYVYPYYKQSCACLARHILNFQNQPEWL